MPSLLRHLLTSATEATRAALLRLRSSAYCCSNSQHDPSSAPSVVARVFSVTYNYFYLDLPYTTQLTTHISQHASKIITLLASKNLFAHLRMWVRAVRTPLSGCADGADAAVP